MRTTLLLAFLLFFIKPLTAEEYGLASYYSDRFQGKKTASGELYRKEKMTCAHKTLPFGTTVRITRLDNNKSITARVNDRGPYVTGRITDVSYAAAKTLGLISTGDSRVKLEVIEYPKNSTLSNPPPVVPKSDPPPVVSSSKPDEFTAKGGETAKTATEVKKETPQSYNAPAPAKKTPVPIKPVVTPPKSPPVVRYEGGYGLYKISAVAKQQGYAIQISSLKDHDNMMRLVNELQSKGLKNVLISIEKDTDNRPFHKVLLGPFNSAASAESYMMSARKKQYFTGGYVINLNTLKYK